MTESVEKKVSTPVENQTKAVDEMEKATKQTLDSMKESGNEKNGQLISQAEARLSTMYSQFRKWLSENTNPEKIKAETEKFKDETVKVLDETRQKAIAISENPTFKQTMESGRQFLSGTGTLISEGFKKGYDRLLEVPEIRKVSDKVDEGIDKLRQNKFLKESTEYLEKGIDDINEHLFSGLNSFFEPEQKASSDSEEEKEKTRK